jgi:calcineurin-like phosphoesterase family protein
MLGKPIFFTSDLHIGHEKAIEYDKRPFKNVDHMHETIITRYNSTVPDNGVCFFVGDIGNRPEEIRKVIARMNGTKALFLGNHDKGMGTMYNCGFDVVLWGGVLYVGDVRITISHCPLIGIRREDTSKMKNPEENWHGESRRKHLMSATRDEGQFHLHGHIHSRPDKAQSRKILDKQYDVGVTSNGYAPVSLSTITSWIAKYGNEKGES